ncbi:unnamed protein product, partial [Allacma fusca]
GGKLIEFYVNNDEDASLAIQQFHLRASNKVNIILSSLTSRPAPDVPSPVSGNELKYRQLTRDFCRLFQEFQTEGLFEPNLAYVGVKILELVCLGSLGLCLVLKSGSLAVTGVGILVLNVFQLRIHYFIHEGGHNSLTGNPRMDRLIQAIAYGLGSKR